MMTDVVTAGAQTGTGPGFVVEDTGSGGPYIVVEKVGFGPHGFVTAVDDAAGKRMPVKPVGPKGSLTDKGGTIAAGGTSQQLAASNASREYLFVQNQHATESLYLNFGGAAATDRTSIELKPNQTFLMTGPGFVCTDAVNVIAATTGHTFAAKEG